MTLLGQVGPCLGALVAGWLVLGPLRRSLGAAGYHLAAVPTGLVVFTVSGALASAMGRPLDYLSIALAAVALRGVVHGAFGVVPRVSRNGSASDPGVGVRSHLIAAASVVVLAGGFAVARVTVATNDALVEFWPMALQFSREPGITSAVMGSRGVLIPALGAVHVLMGADWAYAIYPLVACNLLLLVGAAQYRSTREFPRHWRTVVALGCMLFLVSEAAFAFHSVFVHSHMISGLYLTAALAALSNARRGVERDRSRVAWLALAGVMAAGLALARPDGIAYALVPALVASAVTSEDPPERAVRAFYLPLLAIVGGVYLAAYSILGIWHNSKLNGSLALLVLAALAAPSAIPLVLRAFQRNPETRTGGQRLLWAYVAFAATLLGALAIVRFEDVWLALANGSVNLFAGGGGYGILWWVAVVLIVLSVVNGEAFRAGSVSAFLLPCIVLFYLAALILHGSTHVGRIGDLDSFTRVAFHGLPVIVWYLGAVLTPTVARLTAGENWRFDRLVAHDDAAARSGR